MTRTTLGLHTLENREVPSITLVNGQIQVYGSDYNDSVSVSATYGPGSGEFPNQIVVRRTETGPAANGNTFYFTETKTFDITGVSSVYVNLGNGTNGYAGDHNLPATVIGGNGTDTFTGGGGDDTFYGLGGDDVLVGRGGNDVLVGGPGNDYALPGMGRDVVLAGSGNDFVAARDRHPDRIVGGAGTDRARVDRRLDQVVSTRRVA